MSADLVSLATGKLSLLGHDTASVAKDTGVTVALGTTSKDIAAAEILDVEVSIPERVVVLVWTVDEPPTSRTSTDALIAFCGDKIHDRLDGSFNNELEKAL